MKPEISKLDPRGVVKRASRYLPKVRFSPKAILEHERLTSLINSMADGVIAVDAHTRIVMYNGGALNILDINTDIEGKDLTTLVHLIDNNNQTVDLQSIIYKSTIPTTTRDFRLQYPDGSDINLFLSIAPVRSGYTKRRQKGYVLLLRDITHEKSLEEERDEFISVVSHELRTPIAIAEGNISNALFLTEKSQDMSVIKQALGVAHEQTLFLAGLINDLSTLSRADRGKLNVEIEAINAHDLCQELVQNYIPEAAKKNLEMKSALDPSLELLYSSKLYVREILQNFITNSIKYTASGSVTLGGRAMEKGVEFWVEDTGIGISKADQEKVFDKFYRSEDFRTRENSGTGLGLYVTMKLARLIHADINLESELNQGSTFHIYIPNLERPKQ